MPPNKSGAFRTGLVTAANIWRNEASAKARRHIREAFKISAPVITETGGYIDITNSAPDMAAFEFGSGLHGRKGAKYPIRSKGPYPLHFLWVPGPNSTKQTPGEEEVYFEGVQHPGVHPDPIMQPALNRKRSEMVQAIGRAFTAEVVYKTIREAFRNA